MPTLNAVEWETEAKRIAAAFGCDEANLRIEWDPKDKPFDLRDCWGMLVSTGNYCKGIYFHACATKKAGLHELRVDHGFGKRAEALFFDEHWGDNEWEYFSTDPSLNIYLVRGLLALGFDEEAVLKDLPCTISAHERLEWRLEYKARLEALGVEV